MKVIQYETYKGRKWYKVKFTKIEWGLMMLAGLFLAIGLIGKIGMEEIPEIILWEIIVWLFIRTYSVRMAQKRGKIEVIQ